MSVRGVSLDAGPRSLLREVEFEIVPGEFVAIVGPNGAGKTTLLRAIAGLAPVRTGSIVLDGANVNALSWRARAQRISLLAAEGEGASGLTIREIALTGRFPRRAWWDWTRSEADDRAVDAALGRVGLETFAERDFASLSSGERQRAWIALALAQQSQTLLLDEPTSHLDARYAIETLALLRSIARDEISVVAALHDLNQAAAFADRVALLGEGRVLAFAPPVLALAPELLARAYGIAFERVTAGGETRVFPALRLGYPIGRTPG